MKCSLCFVRDAEKEMLVACDGAHEPTERCEPEPPKFKHWAAFCDPCFVKFADMTPVHNGRSMPAWKYTRRWIKDVRVLSQALPGEEGP